MLLWYLIPVNLDLNMDTFVFISETALKLDSLVGEVEDAVSSVMSKNFNKYSIAQSPEVITGKFDDSYKLVEVVLLSYFSHHIFTGIACQCY